jgi:hypothetical protein
VGTVIRCKVDDTVGKGGVPKPKIKFWIIVGIDQENAALASIYVNTEIAEFIQNNPKLLTGQFLLKAGSREIFDYDCYADCTELKIKELKAIENLLSDHHEFIKGEISQHELAEITHRIKAATTISARNKKRFNIN